MMKKSRLVKLVFFVIAVLYLFNSWSGRESLYYIPSENLYISICLSPISNNYYLFFSKDYISDTTFATNWIKCKNYGRNQFLTLQFDPAAPDYVYNWMYKSFPAQGFTRKPRGSNIIYIQGSVDAITKVHSESLRFMLFHSVENWSGPQEFPEYDIGDYPLYDNHTFELLMYDDRSPNDTVNIIKMTPIWSKRLTKTGWIRKASRRSLEIRRNHAVSTGEQIWRKEETRRKKFKNGDKLLRFSKADKNRGKAQVVFLLSQTRAPTSRKLNF